MLVVCTMLLDKVSFLEVVAVIYQKQAVGVYIMQ